MLRKIICVAFAFMSGCNFSFCVLFIDSEYYGSGLIIAGTLTVLCLGIAIIYAGGGAYEHYKNNREINQRGN